MNARKPAAAGAFDREGPFQAHVTKLAYDLGWGISFAAAKKLDEELAEYSQPPAALDGLVFHPRIMYRSEPGWPDLTLIRRRDRRLVFAELKTDAKTSDVSPRQEKVLQLLDELTTPAPVRTVEGKPCWCSAPSPEYSIESGWVHSPVCTALAALPRIEVFVWRPSDLAEIQRVLA